MNDSGETKAIKIAMGEEEAHKAHISSTKSEMGHALGAAGAIELIISVMTLNNGIIPPTINLDEPDPECDLDYTPKRQSPWNRKNRMTMKRFILITLLVATVFSVQAQKVWTLDECINYALENNLDLRKIQLTRQQAEYQWKISKNAWLPTLSANAGEYFGFGQSPSYTGVYVSDNSSSASFGANLSMPLFQGLNLYNTAKADAFNLQAAEMDEEAARLNLMISVMGFYMQVLYNKEAVEIARKQVELSSDQLQKTQQLYESGRVAEADVYARHSSGRPLRAACF